VKLSRLHVGLLMVAVAIAALNFAALRAVLVHTGLTNELLAVGAVPMMNVLAIGLLVGFRRPHRRRFLLGFTSFVAIALAIYVVIASRIPDETIGPYLRTIVNPIAQIVGTDRSAPLMPIAYYSAAVVALALPQAAFGLLGGFLSRRYLIVMVRRLSGCGRPACCQLVNQLFPATQAERDGGSACDNHPLSRKEPRFLPTIR
jgi:hypothetical protein